jgi:putative endonuclease
MNKGKNYEDIAVSFLKTRGFRVLKRNFRTKQGEIDIIARKGGDIYFIEVKGRKEDSFFLPEEAIHREKLKKMLASAKAYICSLGPGNQYVFGAVSVIDRCGFYEVVFFDNIITDVERI